MKYITPICLKLFFFLMETEQNDLKGLEFFLKTKTNRYVEFYRLGQRLKQL